MSTELIGVLSAAVRPQRASPCASSCLQTPDLSSSRTGRSRSHFGRPWTRPALYPARVAHDPASPLAAPASALPCAALWSYPGVPCHARTRENRALLALHADRLSTAINSRAWQSTPAGSRVGSSSLACLLALPPEGISRSASLKRRA
ncbi:uncharacterized protein [Triticum aestivum]|uniref:uncharacterized protein n=1 Tax=Triticum aestivum TaxID=4565 RepID=UPI001D00C92E|nr:uncharacterized protein LOC123087823 [Triticum aestivum]